MSQYITYVRMHRILSKEIYEHNSLFKQSYAIIQNVHNTKQHTLVHIAYNGIVDTTTNIYTNHE